jgi:hypothetical protein
VRCAQEVGADQQQQQQQQQPFQTLPSWVAPAHLLPSLLLLLAPCKPCPPLCHTLQNPAGGC